MNIRRARNESQIGHLELLATFALGSRDKKVRNSPVFLGNLIVTVFGVLLKLALTHELTYGVFSSRKLERATYESLPFRFLAGDRHPDPDTIANFRR
jgi:hypothetical protein